MFNFSSSLYILDISPLSDVLFFSHSVAFQFTQMMVFFARQKHLSFMRSDLLIVNLSACAKWCSVQKVFSCVNEFKTTPYFLFDQIQYLALG